MPPSMTRRSSVHSVNSYIDNSIAVASQESIPIKRRASDTANKVSIVDTSSLRYFIDAVIVINVIQLGISQDVRGPGWDTLWAVMDHVVAVIFACEMTARMYAHGASYFQNQFNVIDFIVMVTSVVDLILKHFFRSHEAFGMVQCIRLLRLVRIAKLLKVFPAFRCILESMHASFITISWFIVFLGIVIYVVAIACVIIFGSRATGYPGYSDDAGLLTATELDDFNNYKYFGTVWRATLTLFNLTLLSEVSNILRPVNAHQPWAIIFFALFILIMTLCILNSIVGVVVQKTVDAILQHEQNDIRTKRNQMNALNELTQLMFDLDLDGSDHISKDELAAGSENPTLVKLLRDVDFPAGFTLQDLFILLDVDGSGVLGRSEFIGGIFRLLYSNEFQRQCLARLGEAQVRQCICEAKKEIILEMRHDHQRLVRELHQLLFPSGEGPGLVDVEPPSFTRISTPVQTQRTARLDAYMIAAKGIPELRRAFEEGAPHSLQAHASGGQDDGSQLRVQPSSTNSSSPTPPRTDLKSREACAEMALEEEISFYQQKVSSREGMPPEENQEPAIPASTRPQFSTVTESLLPTS